MSATRHQLLSGLVTLLAASIIQCRADSLTTLGDAVSGGYTFLNFDGPNPGTNTGAGTNMNGISNSGAAVGFDIDNNGAFHNFVANINGANFAHLSNPVGTASPLNVNGSMKAQAFGINSAGAVVGTDGNGNAFLSNGGTVTTFVPNGVSAMAFGINDKGNIVGQYTNANDQTPGFYIMSVGGNIVTINSPAGPNIVNAQSINNNGLVAGFYLGNDGQDHGFVTNVANAKNGQITGNAIADPTIPDNVSGEPGATFVFSQLLGVNDSGIVAGYYGDSTTSQHGFFYNIHTGMYTFLDDPAEQFHNGVEVTQITGINNLDEITGFYSDANGVFHSFVACPTGSTCTPANTAAPEPDSLLLGSLGFMALGFGCLRRRIFRS